MDNKLIDLHKVASLFREIQTEEFTKEEAKEDSQFKKTVKEIETPVEETTDQTVEEAQSPAQKAAFQKMLDKKNGSKDEEATEESAEEKVEEHQKFATDPVIAVIKDTPVAEEEVAEEEVTEEPKQVVAMDTDTLAQILNLAGLKPVTDADINQPEADAQPVEEYSNSPDEEYADADTQLNKMSGGINRPKAMPTVGNDGHNRLVMKLKKSYSDME
jgi:chemotaxis protein histidine kinase CheA